MIRRPVSVSPSVPAAASDPVSGAARPPRAGVPWVKRTFFPLLLLLSGLPAAAASPEKDTCCPLSVEPRREGTVDVTGSTGGGGAPSSSPAAPSAEEVQTMRQTRQRIFGEIERLIGKPAAGLTAEHWKTVRAKYGKPEFDRTVEPAAGPKNVRDLLKTPKGKEPLMVQILTARFSDISDKTEQDAMLAFHTMALITAASGGASLPAALEDRTGDADITRGDVILFEVLDDAFVDMPRRERVSKTELDQWTRLAASPNSLHRLLALRTYLRVAPDPGQWLDFYRAYVNEQDPGILEEVIGFAFNTARPEAAEVLAEIRARPGVAANPDLAARLDRSIDFLRKLPSRGQ